MRNLQVNLIPKWNSANKVSEIIKELPNLCNDFEYQINRGLLPNLGTYSIKSDNYDINYLLRNQNNKCFKIFIPTKDEEEEKTVFHSRYFDITSESFIILESTNERYKNICKINYVGNIYEIEEIQKFSEEGEEYKDYTCFKIKWNKNYNNQLNLTMCGDSKSLIVKKITKCLEERREIIKNSFKLIQKNDSANIKIYENIINIKEKLVEDKINDSIYEEINGLYQKIIEVLASLNGNDFKKYLEKLQNFINKYDKLKMKEDEKKKLSKKNENTKS